MTDLDRPNELRFRAFLLIAVGAWLTICALRPHLPVNPVSRLATIESLVDYGEWSIDESRFTRMTVDKVQVDGRFYSSKPPLLPAIGAGVYWLAQRTLGLTFAEDVHATTFVLRIALGILPWLAGMLALGRLLDVMVRDSYARVWVFTSAAVGSLATAYASDVSNHTPAWAAMLVAAALAAPALESSAATTLRVGAAGLVGGLASALDLGAIPTVGLFGAGFFVWLLREKRARAAFAFAASGLVFPTVQVALNYSISGSWRPFYLQPGAYHYEGSYWTRPIEFDALSENKIIYFLHETVGHHGMLATSPFLAVGLWYLVRHREQPMLGRVLRGAAAVTVAFTWLYYTYKMSNYGGRAVGMRWFLVTEPALLLATARAADLWSFPRRWPIVAGALTGAAAVSILGGAINAWEEGFVYVLFQTLGLASIEG